MKGCGDGGGGGLPALASPPENDDLLLEILLRLPPAPSSLPRASVVCKRWRRLVTDPGFLRRFRSRHRRSAPRLGFFTREPRGLSFTPTLEPPDRIPSSCLSSPVYNSYEWNILDCRHGLILLLKRKRNPHLQLLVWDPVTGDLSCVDVPARFGDRGNADHYQGAVLPAAGGDHGGGHPIPFMVVLVGFDDELEEAAACVYSSENGVWGNPTILTLCSRMFPVGTPGALVGGSLYWVLFGDLTSVLQLDLDRHCLAVIDAPQGTPSYAHCLYRVVPLEGGVLGFLLLSGSSVQLWKWETDCDGVAGWVLGRTIEINNLLSQPSTGIVGNMIFGFAEDDNVLFLRTSVGVFTIQLDSMVVGKFEGHTARFYSHYCHPFTSVYTAGMRILGGHEGSD
ncbi:hypothetical protein ACP70R_029361 [Stipagrostis hirtigluma subsp. patula]